MKKTIKYLQDGEYHYATVKDVGDLEQLKTKHKEDLVTALNELFTTGGNAKPTGYDDLVKKVNDTQTTVNGINNTIVDVNGKIAANDEAIAQAKKDLQDALTQFQTFNDEIEQAKKDAETKLANAKQALKDEFNANLADAQKANQKQLEDKIAVIQGNLDTTSNTLNDVKTQLANAKLDYGNVNVSIQKLNDMLSTKLSSTDLDPLRTSIQNQETEIQQTKDSIATKAGKAELNALSGRVSNTEAKIKQQADEISLGVKKSELNGAIDNYQIEGTNRLRDTIDFDIDGGYWKLDRYSINSNTDVHPYDQAHDVSALVLQKTGSAKQNVDFTNEDLGQSFVVSMWNKKDAQPQVWYGNTQLTNRQVAEIKGDYERSFFTFIPTNVNVKTIMFKYDAGTVDQLVIGEPKLELGTKPKAYAPNPNDEHKQIVHTKAELKIASDKIESTVAKQTKTDNNINQLSSRVTQTEQGITATNDLITKTKDGLIKDYTGKINASAKSLSSEFEEKTNEKIGQITDSGENLILNSAFTNETDRKDKWQNISDRVNIVDDGNGLMWAYLSQSGLTTDNPISLTSNYFPIKQGKITVGVDIKSDNTNGLSGAKILVLQTYNANKQRVDFTEISLENMGLTVQQLADGQSHRGVYRLGNDRSDAVYMTVKAVLPRNGSIYFTNFSAKLSSIDNGGYTPNAEDLKRQILNQKTKIEQNSQQITLKASSTELRDVRTIANGAVSSASDANNKIDNLPTSTNIYSNLPNSWYNGTLSENQSSGVNWKTTFINGYTNRIRPGYNAYDVTPATGTITISWADGWKVFLLEYDSNKNYIGKQANSVWHATSPYTVKLTNNTRYIALALAKTDDSNISPNDLIDSKGSPVVGLKVEQGSTATPFSWCARDIQSQIDQARTDIQSTLTVANNGITAATNLKTTYDNYVQKNDANIKLLGDRITNEVSSVNSRVDNLQIGGRNYIKDSESITMYPNGTDNYDLVWSVYNNAFSANAYCHGNNKTRFSFYLKPSKALSTARTFPIYWRQEPWTSFGTITVPANTTDTQYYELTMTTPTNQPIASQIFMRFMAQDTSDISYTITKSMLTIGDSFPDWQPAPEDTSSQIEAVSSKIDQTATSITSTVNSTKQDLQGQINSANTKITQTANSITEQLKSYSKTGDMQNYVNTTIQKTADGINAKVSGVETSLANANSKIDGITSNGGGRNLLRYSTNDSGKFQPNCSRIDNYIIYAASTAYMTQGQQYTVHANASNGLAWSSTHNPSVESNNVVLWLVDNKSVNQIISDANTGTGTTFTWNHPSGTYYLRVNTYKADNSGYVVRVMLEKGIVAHDWSPAPEDTDSAIQTTKADLVQQITDAKNAAIKVSKDSINSEVSDVRTTITQVNNKVDGVVSVANTANTTANSALTKANSATTVANQANNNASSANNNANQAINTANQANSKVDDIQANGGGRNLLHGTSGDWITKTATSWMNVTTANSNKTSVADYRTGDKFTYSAMVLNKSNVNVRLELYCCDNNGNRLNGDSHHALSDYVAPNTTAKRISCTITIDSNTWYVEHTLIADGGTSTSKTVQIKGEMFEYSTVAHDWSPAPEDVATDISNVNTKVEQYKTGIDQTATGMNLFAQVITGNKSIDVTKSNIGIDPNQIKIASNRIVIDGDTSINGTLNVPNVVLKGKNGSIDLSGDAINIKNSNSTYGLTLASDGVAVGDKDKFYGLFTSASLDFFMKTQNASRPYSLGAIEESHLVANTDVHGISIVGKPYKDNKGNNFQGGNYIDFSFDDPNSTQANPMIRLVWRDLENVNNGTVRKGIHVCDNIYVDQSATCIFPPGTQDPLMITGLKFSNSTQSDFFQPTLQAGRSNSLKGDSGLTFFWNSVRAFGTLDLTGTQIRMADAEANLEFGWTSWNDWPGKIPSLFRRNGNNTGGIAIGSDSNVILFGNGHRWNLNERGGY